MEIQSAARGLREPKRADALPLPPLLPNHNPPGPMQRRAPLNAARQVERGKVIARAKSAIDSNRADHKLQLTPRWNAPAPIQRMIM